MEWLCDQIHADAGIVSSSRKKGKQPVVRKVVQPSDEVNGFKRKKVGGVLRHSVYSLKKVARLPNNDRVAVLHDFKRMICKRHGKEGVSRSTDNVSKVVSHGASSSSSVNNDWKNWVVLKGDEDVEVEDVWGMGKSIGVHFKRDSHNMFSVLSRTKRDKNKS